MIYFLVKDSDNTILDKSLEDDLTADTGETVRSNMQEAFWGVENDHLIWNGTAIEYSVDELSFDGLCTSKEERRFLMNEIYSEVTALIVESESVTEDVAYHKLKRLLKSITDGIEAYKEYNDRRKDATHNPNDGLLDMIDNANRTTFDWLDSEPASITGNIGDYMIDKLDY